MPKFLLVVVLICAGGLEACTLWAEHPVKNWSDATGGESLERNLWMEVKAKNWRELEKHVAGNFITASVAGTRDKTSALERLRQLQVDEFSIGEVQVELNGDALVVTYSLTLKGSAAGAPLSPEPRRMMSVWQKQKSGWVIIAHSNLGQATN